MIRLLSIKTEAGLQKQEDKDLNLTLTGSTLQFISRDFPVELDDKVMEQIRKIHETDYSILSKKSRDPLTKTKQVTQLNFITQMLSAQPEVVKYQHNLLIRFQKEGKFNEHAISKAVLDLDIEKLRINSRMVKREVSSSGIH